MKDIKILCEAIRKAVSNGWNCNIFTSPPQKVEFSVERNVLFVYGFWKDSKDRGQYHIKGKFWHDFTGLDLMGGAYNIIFDHNFAKYFFGEIKTEMMCNDNPHVPPEKCVFDDKDASPKDCQMDSNKNCNSYIKAEFYQTGWQYHLQQMVLEENPLKYLEKFL